MPKNKLSDLRNHLFATLEELTEQGASSLDLPMKIQKAKAVANVAQTIVNSAKVEVEYLVATGQADAKSEFLEAERPALPAPASRVLPAHAAASNGHNGNGAKKGLSTGKNLGTELQ